MAARRLWVEAAPATEVMSSPRRDGRCPRRGEPRPPTGVLGSPNEILVVGERVVGDWLIGKHGGDRPHWPCRFSQ